MDNGAWLALGAAAVAVGAASARGGANRVALKRGDRVAYNPDYLEKRRMAPGDKAYALAARGTAVDVSGGLVNVRWDGGGDLHTYSYPGEVTREDLAAAKLDDRARRAQARAPSWDDMTLTRKGDLVTPDGVLNLEPIGKGMFSKVYRQDARGRVVAIVASDTWDKQIVSDAHESSPENPHIPAVERMGTLTDGRMVYVMPHYTAPYRKGNAKPEQHRAYLQISKCVGSVYTRHRERPIHVAHRKLSCIEDAGLSGPIVDAIRELLDSSANYGDEYNIEFSPRNVATDEQGNIVLLDLIFSADAVSRANEQKLRKRGLFW